MTNYTVFPLLIKAFFTGNKILHMTVRQIEKTLGKITLNLCHVPFLPYLQKHFLSLDASIFF